MKCRILHESSGRIRVHILRSRMTLAQADLLEYYLKDLSCVRQVKVYDRTGDAVIRYEKGGDGRRLVIEALSRFSYEDEQAKSLVPEQTGRALNRAYEQKLFWLIAAKLVRRVCFPYDCKRLWTMGSSVKFILQGLRCLRKGRLEVAVLDATAIIASMLQKDFETAASVMFLLNLGELLEEWTHKKSVDDLARTMALNVEKVWVQTLDGEEVLTDIKEVKLGDRIVLRSSNLIPLDGRLIEGVASVNQASMTGESIPVMKQPGGYVYAGTVVEDGNCVVEVMKTTGTGKYDRIVKMIEESEKLKSDTETKAYHLADSLVPYSLAGTALTYLLTRNINQALSFLMVDFSCALKLSMPLSVMSAMREAGRYNITVKGGKFLEALAEAETVVFDKTGTLTYAAPTVERIIPFGGSDETECLRVAACLEEHFPHSMANAVVNEAKKRNVEHDEMHEQVSYVVAHGIASKVDGKKVVIGSRHFVFEDEGCVIPEGEEEKLSVLNGEYSYLYLAVDGMLTAVICIADPVRAEAKEVIEGLHELGVKKVCMLTGDNQKTAETVAKKIGLDEYLAEVLPEDKAAYIKQEQSAGRKVIMIGDGVNDTLALSEADVGIAVSDGAMIAREISDVTVSDVDLHQLIVLRKVSMRLKERIDLNYRFIISFNACLIFLGVFGILPPSSSALLHNSSTIIAGLKSMTPLLEEKDEWKRS